MATGERPGGDPAEPGLPAPGEVAADGAPREAREEALFEALRVDAEPGVPAAALREALARAGLRPGDPRLAESLAVLDATPAGGRLDLAGFRAVLRPGIGLLERALRGRLVLPDFAGVRADIDALYARTRGRTDGVVADYIPQLARVDPELFGVALCSVDGQRHAAGDAGTEFCLQSTCKPLNYCIALEERGEAGVHRHVGREPSGKSFNALTLNEDGLPHNPMINAGAVMTCSMIRPELTSADRFDHVMETWRRAAGGRKPGFSNPTYLSERRTADRNYALGYFMREKGAFPAGTDLVETLEFYFQCCSLELDAEAMAVVAATLAAGGVCPLTGERVFRPETVRKCLSLMGSCGMYDFSGEWAFHIGLPAKSGVSGAVFVVVPEVMGLCAFSPRLDRIGNSVRGVEFFRELVGTYSFHRYDSLVGGAGGKRDPHRGAAAGRPPGVAELCWAAAEGDLGEVRRLLACGARPERADYDGRTPLHLAVCGGRREVVELLLRHEVPPSPRDRWGGTPLDDALREGRHDLAELLEAAGATRGGPPPGRDLD